MSRRGLASGYLLALRLCAPCTKLCSLGLGVPASLGRVRFRLDAPASTLLETRLVGNERLCDA